MSLENYEPVAVRLARLLETLRAQGESPRIVTNMLSEPGADICVFRAELWLGDMLMATGHAEEIRGQGNVNRTSHVENCETSSLGRMCESYFPTPDLAKRPSREEMQKVERAQTSNPGYEGTTIKVGPGAASEKQIGYIKGACKRDGVVPPTWVDTLTKQEASAFIEAHKNGEAPSSIIARIGSEEEPF